MLDKIPTDMLIRIYYAMIGFDEVHVLGVRWHLVPLYYYRLARTSKETHRVLRRLPDAIRRMATVATLRVARCTDEIDEVTDDPEKELSYLYGPILTGQAVLHDATCLPVPDIVLVPLNDTDAGSYTEKVIEYMTICVPIGVPFTMSESDMAPRTLYKYNTVGNMMSPPPKIVHNADVVRGRCHCQYVRLLVYRDTASGEDGDEYSRFLYMLLVEDESVTALNHKFYGELSEKYPMYELEECYILNLRASAASRHHMVRFHRGADPDHIECNRACVFPILKNCSVFCPNCDDDNESDDDDGDDDGDDDDDDGDDDGDAGVLVLDTSDEESNYEDEDERGVYDDDLDYLLSEADSV